jgi:hypothetical protein
MLMKHTQVSREGVVTDPVSYLQTLARCVSDTVATCSIDVRSSYFRADVHGWRLEQHSQEGQSSFELGIPCGNGADS